MLDTPARIFRCPICIEHGIEAPLQDLSLLIEHLAKHFQFFLFECRHCKDRFLTPFLANFHIKEGRCKPDDRKFNVDDKQPLSCVNLNDVDFSSFCCIQNVITKCIRNMLTEQTRRIPHLMRKNEGRTKVRPEGRKPHSAERPASSAITPPRKRPYPPEESARDKGPGDLDHHSIHHKISSDMRSFLTKNANEVFGIEPPRRDVRTTVWKNQQNLRKSRELRAFQDYAYYDRDIRGFQNTSPGYFERRSFWDRGERQATAEKLPSLSEAFASWRCDKTTLPY